MVSASIFMASWCGWFATPAKDHHYPAAQARRLLNQNEQEQRTTPKRAKCPGGTWRRPGKKEFAIAARLPAA